MLLDLVPFLSHWCYGKWPASWAHQNIAMLEFYPIVLSLHLSGEVMSNQCVLFNLLITNPWYILSISSLARISF